MKGATSAATATVATTVVTRRVVGTAATATATATTAVIAGRVVGATATAGKDHEAVGRTIRDGVVGIQ